MKIILYKNTAPERKVNKTNFLSLVMEMDGFLREESSVTNPVLMLETSVNFQPIQANGEDVVANGELLEHDYQVADTMPEFNYAYIPDFKRYYFLVEIVSVRERLWRVSFRCDVLMSFKSDFVQEGLYFFCERSSEAVAREVLDDPLISWSEKEDVSYTDLTLGTQTYKNITFNTQCEDVNEDRVTLYVTMNGVKRQEVEPWTDGRTYSYGITPWESGGVNPPIIAFTLPNINGSAVQVNSNDVPYVLSVFKMNQIQRGLNIDDSKVQSIISAVIWPFVIPASMRSNGWYKLAIGDTSFVVPPTPDEIFARVLMTSCVLPYLILAEFDAPIAQSFEDIPQHCSYDVYLPYYGWTTLDVVAHGGHHFIIYYALSIIDGAGSVNLYDTTADSLVFTAPVQVGRKIILTTTNNRENQVQSNSLALNAVLGSIGAVLGIAGGIATGNPLLIAGGVASGLATAGKTVIGAQSIIERGSISFGSEATNFFSPLKPYLRRKRKLPAIAYGSSQYVLFNGLKGHPVKSTICLYDYDKGYFLLADSKHISSGTATDGELTELQSILNTGFFL